MKTFYFDGREVENYGPLALKYNFNGLCKPIALTKHGFCAVYVYLMTEKIQPFTSLDI